MQRPALDPEYRAILEKVRSQKLRYNPCDDLLQVALRKPPSIAGFVCHAIEAVPEMMGYWESVLDWMPEEDWPIVIQAAITALMKGRQTSKPKQKFDLESPDILSLAENLDTADYDAVYDVYSQIAGISGRNMVAESVISRAANQFPKLLHPHLRVLFNHALEEQTIFGLSPFRFAGAADHDFLWDVIYDDDTSAREKARAFDALLLSGDLNVMKRAIAIADKVDFEADAQETFAGWNLPSRTQDQHLDYALRAVGHEIQQDQIRRLYNPTAWHIRLAESSYEVPAHPTWDLQLADVNVQAQCGKRCSKNCDVCRAPVIRLLQIPAAANLSDATFRYPPAIDLCFYCFQNENIYFELDQEGIVTVKEVEAGDSSEVNGDIPTRVIPIVFSQMPSRWSFQNWGGANGANLYRLGGEPSWVQGPEYPACPHCECKMNFILQHIMNYPKPADEHEDTHSDGITYYFWCASCRIYLARSQYT